MIIKIDKGTMERVGSVTLDAGEDDVRAIHFDTSTSALYASTNTVPGHVVKIDTIGMKRVAAATLSLGKNLTVSFADDKFIFVSSNTEPAVVSKIAQKSMLVHTEKSVAHGKSIATMAADEDHLYCG